jgi:predicted CoA-binding protein
MANPACELPEYNPPAPEIIELLKTCRRIAVVGLSPKEHRDSHRVARYMLEQGYEIIPVNPGQREILGRPCFKTLNHIPFPVDMVNLFLNPSRVPPVVDQAIALGARAVWMQLGVVHNASAQKARRAGLQVVMNMCLMTEHQNSCS